MERTIVALLDTSLVSISWVLKSIFYCISINIYCKRHPDLDTHTYFKAQEPKKDKINTNNYNIGIGPFFFHRIPDFLIEIYSPFDGSHLSNTRVYVGQIIEASREARLCTYALNFDSRIPPNCEGKSLDLG